MQKLLVGRTSSTEGPGYRSLSVPGVQHCRGCDLMETLALAPLGSQKYASRLAPVGPDIVEVS